MCLSRRCRCSLLLQIEETLHDEHSEHQHIQVFQTKTYGRMLALDGVIQITERDEASYQVRRRRRAGACLELTAQRQRSATLKSPVRCCRRHRRRRHRR